MSMFCSRSPNSLPSIGSFSTVRHRTKVTKGPGSRAAGMAMAFELLEATHVPWRMVNEPQLVALVRAGAVFVNGVLIERAAPAAA